MSKVESPKVVKSKVQKATKSTDPVVAPVAPVVESVVAPVVESVVAEKVSFKQRLESLIRTRVEHIGALKREVQELKKLQREHEVLIKEASKKNKKKVVRDFSKPRKATGFAEPVVVSAELYSFLVKTKALMKDPTFVPKSQEDLGKWPRISVKTGAPVARTDVTSHISKYIKDHKLQNPEAKREILPDAALKKIFTDPSAPHAHATYNYLQLQKYLNHHFKKA